MTMRLNPDEHLIPLPCWKSEHAEEQIKKNSCDDPAGIAVRDDVFNNKTNITKKVFAIELLENDLVLEKRPAIYHENREVEKEKIVVTVNRRKGRGRKSYALYTTLGKSNLASYLFHGRILSKKERQELKEKNKCERQKSSYAVPKPHEKRVEFAKKVDSEVHNFFLNKSETTKLIINLKHLPLRWASAGVLCIVDFQDKEWVPFFYRDIAPVGWNIPLGASENETEASNPWHIIWREFIEEFLVLEQSPENGSNELPIKVKELLIQDVQIPDDRNKAKELIDKHIDLRHKYDGLDLKIDTENTKNKINCLKVDTDIELEISSVSRSQILKDVLIAVNPFELGIEVVSILSMKLGDEDYLLDGEILEDQTDPDAYKELIRMPFALISLEYLEKVFKGGSFSLTKDDVSESSVEMDDIPSEEIKIFDWDIKRRVAILKNKSTAATPNEAIRYERWYEQHGDKFLKNNNGEIDLIDYKDDEYKAPGVFTPASAKIISYYFAMHDRMNENKPTELDEVW